MYSILYSIDKRDVFTNYQQMSKKFYPPKAMEKVSFLGCNMNFKLEGSKRNHYSTLKKKKNDLSILASTNVSICTI